MAEYVAVTSIILDHGSLPKENCIEPGYDLHFATNPAIFSACKFRMIIDFKSDPILFIFDRKQLS